MRVFLHVILHPCDGAESRRRVLRVNFSSICRRTRRSNLEKDVEPNMSATLHHPWDLTVRLMCHPDSAERSVIHHPQIVRQHGLSLQSAFDG